MPALELPLLLQLHDLLYSVPFAPVMFLHCLFCSSLAPDFKDHFLLHYWLTFLGGFGGGTVSSLLLLSPANATIAAFSINVLGVAWTVAWWLNNYCPGGLPSKVHSFWPVKMLTKACTILLKSQTIIARVNQAVRVYPAVIAAPLILGTIGGCGGKLCSDAIRGAWGKLHAPAELTLPSFSWRSSFLSALAYYLAAYHFAIIGIKEAAALVVFLNVFHSLLSDVTGRPCDFTAPFFDLFHMVTFIPKGPATAAAKKAAAPTKAGVAAPASVAKRVTSKKAAATAAADEDAGDKDDGEPSSAAAVVAVAPVVAKSRAAATPAPHRTTRSKKAA